jgi:hypothetical protein
MIRIAITPASTIASTMALRTVAVEPERAQDGSVHIWLDPWRRGQAQGRGGELLSLALG